ncbi:MAG: TIGR02281 family clan AA aspartic protease [Xanthobacteraceae bacterium]
MRSIIGLAAVALAAAVLVPRYLMQHATVASVAPTTISAHSDTPVEPNLGNTRAIVVVPDSHGHFRVDGRVDARPMDFVVDTGERDAEMLGIHPAASDYTIAVSSANGTARAAPVTLNKVEIGSITIRDVAAMVMPENALSENLLGMTFLSRLQR